MSDNTQHTFKAEIKQLLDILIHSLYKERDIFLRELISNASDALTRLQFEMLTNQDIVDPEVELSITLATEKPEEGEAGDRYLIITDTGIGMTAEEMQNNLGTIAQSGAREFLSKMGEQSEKPDINDVIGQFGVGFYSVFMAADEVTVTSRSYMKDAEAARWIAQGGDSYTIEAADKESRGTEIRIKLNSDSAEFADDWQLRQIIKKHSDFVAYPIYIGEEQVNQKESIWRKRPNDVSDEEYAQFYQMTTMDFEAPLSHIHFSSDAPLDVRALLYLPSKREKSMFHRRPEVGVMLYSKNVLIQEYCQDLLPKWLPFVDGVVDSEDLPLNVSRETVQNSRIMRQLGKTVRKRVLRAIDGILEDEEKGLSFWNEFGRYLKEGLVIEPTDRDDIMPRLRFFSSDSDGTLISLKEYIGRMPEEQNEIYYVLGDDLASVKNSPHLDPFKARNIEVLYLIDPFDAYMASGLTDFEEKSFRNVDDSTLELPEIDPEESSEEIDESPAIEEDTLATLIEQIKAILGEKVTDVRASKVLSSSPMRLLKPEDSTHNSAMGRVYRFVGQEYEVPAMILEINPKHALIANLADQASAEAKGDSFNLTIEQLYDSALVQEGMHPNPVDMLPRIQKLMELATRS